MLFSNDNWFLQDEDFDNWVIDAEIYCRMLWQSHAVSILYPEDKPTRYVQIVDELGDERLARHILM